PAGPPRRGPPGAKRGGRPGGPAKGPQGGGGGGDRRRHRRVDGPGQTADGAIRVTNEGGEPRRADTHPHDLRIQRRPPPLGKGEEVAGNDFRRPSLSGDGHPRAPQLETFGTGRERDPAAGATDIDSQEHLLTLLRRSAGVTCSCRRSAPKRSASSR